MQPRRSRLSRSALPGLGPTWRALCNSKSDLGRAGENTLVAMMVLRFASYVWACGTSSGFVDLPPLAVCQVIADEMMSHWLAFIVIRL